MPKLAIEKDDLSLLAGLPDKEKAKLNSRGIFSVTQLSYTFRPRRRSKRQAGRPEKYHHALKALAIREKKIHVVGTPQLRIEGTPGFSMSKVCRTAIFTIWPVFNGPLRTVWNDGAYG